MLESAGSSFVSFNGVLASLTTAVLINLLINPPSMLYKSVARKGSKEALACQFSITDEPDELAIDFVALSLLCSSLSDEADFETTLASSLLVAGH